MLRRHTKDHLLNLLYLLSVLAEMCFHQSYCWNNSSDILVLRCRYWYCFFLLDLFCFFSSIVFFFFCLYRAHRQGVWSAKILITSIVYNYGLAH